MYRILLSMKNQNANNKQHTLKYLGEEGREKVHVTEFQ